MEGEGLGNLAMCRGVCQVDQGYTHEGNGVSMIYLYTVRWGTVHILDHMVYHQIVNLLSM